MGTFGQALKKSRTANNYCGIAVDKPASKMAGIAVVLLIVSFSLYGCMGTMQMGNPPATDRLDRLVVDVSTARDVKAALGAPQGIGAVRSASFGTKEAWLYEHTQMDGKTANIRMLMIFLDQERGVYHGHLWFSSGMLIGQTQPKGN